MPSMNESAGVAESATAKVEGISITFRDCEEVRISGTATLPIAVARSAEDQRLRPGTPLVTGQICAEHLRLASGSK